MGVVGSGRFRGLLASLDAEELAAFVADAWRARGWAIRVEGTRVTASGGPVGGTLRFACVSPDRLGRAALPGDDVDVVVATRPSGRVQTAAEDRGARFLGPDELRDVVLYAMERRAAERLFASHFSRPLALDRPAVPVGGRLPAGLPWRALGAAVLLVLLAGVVLAGAGANPFADAGGEPSSPGLTTPEAAGTGASTSGGEGPPAGQYPPGLAPEGVTDAEALATAHGQSLVGTTYDMLVIHEGSADLLLPDREWTFSRQTVARVSPIHFWYRFAGVEVTANGTREVVFDDYADHTYDYRRIAGPGPAEYRRGLIPTGGGNGLFTAVGEAYVARYLATDRSRVEALDRDAETMFRVVATGTPHRVRGPVAGYRAVAVVDRTGQVHRLRVRYARPTSDSMSVTASGVDTGAVYETVEFELVYRDVGGTTLQEPAWYDEARNATNRTVIDLWSVERRWWSPSNRQSTSSTAVKPG